MKTIVRFGPEGAVEHVEGIAPNPLSGNPVTHTWRCFVHPSGKLIAGFWSCEGGTFEIMSHPCSEMCSILVGEAVFVHEDGSQVTVAPGDSFVIPYGAHTIWHVEGYVRKSFTCHFMENDGPAA